MGRTKKRMITRSIVLPIETWEELDELSDINMRSTSSIIREVVLNWLEAMNEESDQRDKEYGHISN